jgi:hypothetical protein
LQTVPFTAAEAGSPNTCDGDRYPLRALFGIDNTCRDACGFDPAGSEPGLCGYPGTISGRVFYDENANGRQDKSWEEGRPNLQVPLGSGACPSAGLATAATDALGDYSFRLIPQGRYCVTFVYPEIWNAAVHAAPNPRTVDLPPEGNVIVDFGVHTAEYGS